MNHSNYKQMSHLNVHYSNFHSLSFLTTSATPLSLSMKTHRKYLLWPTLQRELGSVWACSQFCSYFLYRIFLGFYTHPSWTLWAINVQKAEKETLEIVLKHLNRWMSSTSSLVIKD